MDRLLLWIQTWMISFCKIGESIFIASAAYLKAVFLGTHRMSLKERHRMSLKERHRMFS